MILVVVGILVVLGALLGGPVLERGRRSAEMEALRAALEQARYAADSCMLALAVQQDDFLRFDRMVDSLRTATEGFEDPDQGGVPQGEYREYLNSFDSYNAAVEEWGPLADSLRGSEASCRGIVEAHNRLGDSIRRIREEMSGGVPTP